MFSGPFRMHCCNIKEKTLGKYLNLNKHLSQIWATPPDKKSISHVQIDDGSFNKKVDINYFGRITCTKISNVYM